MRQALLIPVIAVFCLIAPFQPLVGVYAYVWFACMRPDALAWSHLPYSFALALATLLGTVRYLGRVTVLFHNPICVAVLLLQVPYFLSVVLAVRRQLAIVPYIEFMKMLIMAMLVPLFIDSLERLRTLLLIIGLSIGALGSRWGIHAIASGGVRFSTGFAGMMSENNSVALALVMIIPICWYGRDLISKRFTKWTLVVISALSMVAIIMTFSRGGALSLAVSLALIGKRAKRKLPIILLRVAFAGGGAYMVRDEYLARLSTMRAPAGENSAAARLLYIKVAYRMWKDHPLFGVGFGTLNEQRLMERYTELTEHGPQVLHNTYTQNLADSGIFAFLIYIGMVYGTIFYLQRSIKRVRKRRPDLAPYPMALQTSLIGFAVGCTFISWVHVDLLYFLIFAAAVWYRLEHEMMLHEPDAPEAAEAEHLTMAVPAY